MKVSHDRNCKTYFKWNCVQYVGDYYQYVCCVELENTVDDCKHSSRFLPEKANQVHLGFSNNLLVSTDMSIEQFCIPD